MKKDFEQLPHTADIKLRVYDTTVQELFRHAVIGMFQSIEPQTDVAGCTVTNERLHCDLLPEKQVVTVQAGDLESLLVDFLSEALYLSDVHNQAYLDAVIKEFTRADGQASITATLLGVPITGFDLVEIKAVTYHGLEVNEVEGGWQADIVFDI